MTVKYEYKCDKCSHEYIEQRSETELTPYFSTCHACGNGTYQEVSQTTLSE